VFNNTFASSPAWTGASAYGVEFHNVKNAKLQNNIFYNIGHNTAPYVFVDAVRDGLTVGNNLVYDSDGSAPVLPEASIPRSGDVWQPSLGPKFANAAVYDYHLQSGSPAINAGTNVSNGHDKDNYTRTSGSYDIGAYEYH
jgi:hypothetical protein